MKKALLGSPVEFVYKDVAKTGVVTVLVFAVLLSIYFFV